MHRIDNSTAVVSLPTPAATGSPGFFTNGNPSTGSPATIVDQDWFNTVQEELMAILTAASVTASKTTNNQVLTAINSLIASGSTARTRLTTNTTLYVSTTGNDSTGTGAVGAPWLTIQHAVNVIANTVDLAGYALTIQVADGTYTTPVVISQPFVGGIPLIQGNLTTPANCKIQTTSADCFYVKNGAAVSLAGFQLKTTTSGNCLRLNFAANVNLTGLMDFNVSANYHILVDSNSELLLSANYTISGAASAHYVGNLNGSIYANGITITITGTPAFSVAFAATSKCATINAQAMTFTGSATGARYNLSSNSVVDTNGGGATYLPGNSAGSLGSGGQYV